jgi:hypothetical protein
MDYFASPAITLYALSFLYRNNTLGFTTYHFIAFAL